MSCDEPTDHIHDAWLHQLLLCDGCLLRPSVWNAKGDKILKFRKFILKRSLPIPVCCLSRAHAQVFTADAMLKYLRMFNFLWRGKRMEYCLANMWREQIANNRKLQTIKGIHHVLITCHTLSTLPHSGHFISLL